MAVEIIQTQENVYRVNNKCVYIDSYDNAKALQELTTAENEAFLKHINSKNKLS
ncbi:hypothetical protein GCM10007424_23450 [Flavobacterium suaedae]|uniref:Uncharacterized protein n=1 Tax=Flavobacterium suaedae TaxID=1767027 RepID=A0ABQ1K2T6_9FLAO|nr:hypothetical protein [Flavobacterium suaedae]GGB82725.1 hypothetical protein GCM10007424_23450 [Flavobacterium suaedae]